MGLAAGPPVRPSRVGRRHRAAGFVLTLELLLIVALVVIPILIGLILLGRKAYTLYLAQREFIDQPYSRAVVWDSSATPKVIGAVIGYDPFEAPLVVFRDAAAGGGVVLGVRPTRITSYGEVYYDDDTCTTNPRIRAHDSPKATVSGNPPIGFAYQMLGRSYAMGRGNVLYASSTPVTGSTTVDGTSVWVWTSQDVTKNASCFKPVGLVQDLVVPDVVIDFDGAGNYVTPFRLAFPSPGAMPGVSSSGG